MVSEDEREACLRAAMVYGGETWVMRKEEELFCRERRGLWRG
jgi:hypothetical protein